MRILGVLLVALACLSAMPSIVAADRHDTASARGVQPGNGSAEMATQPPADLSAPAHNVSERLRALHPEAILAVLVALLLGGSVVLSLLMIRDAYRRPHSDSARKP